MLCSFWNFDALFQPQQHPARDAHDTFFLTSTPSAPLMQPSAAFVIFTIFIDGNLHLQTLLCKILLQLILV